MAVIKGDNGPDDIFGTNSADTIYGYGGNDNIYGYGGNDVIYGGAGDDDLYGGTGANNLYGGSGSDWFIMSARGAGLSDDYIADFEFDIDRIDVVTWGVSDFSQIQALLKNDTDGNAYFNAYFSGYNHFVTVNQVSSTQLETGDFVFSTAAGGQKNGTGYDDVVFGSRYVDTLNGGAGQDILLGGVGNDTLYGGVGNDTLIGGLGVDRLNGSTGADSFKFNFTTESVTAGSDIILDFTPDVDVIDISGIDARTTQAGNQAFAFIGTAAFTAAGQVHYFFSGNYTVVQLNTNTDAAAEAQIMISGRIDLIPGDFVL